MTSCTQPPDSNHDSDAVSADTGAVIEQVNQQLGQTLSWQRMSHGGSSNALLSAELDGKPVVLRINAPDQLAFGVNRNRETDVLKLIQPYNWAPQVLLADKQLRWCLMVDHGQTPAQPIGSDLLKSLLDAVGQWQVITSGAIINYTDLYLCYRQVFREQEDQQALSLLDLIEQRQSCLPLLSGCLTHHDLHPGNLCRKGQQLTVLDWEYAGLGNPWFDIAALRRFFAVPVTNLHRLPAVQGLTGSVFEQGLVQAVWISEALDALWYRVRGDDAMQNRVQQMLHSALSE